MKRVLTAIILSIASLLPIFAQNVSVVAELDSAIITMGSQLHMTVDVNLPTNDSTARIVNAPEIQNEELGFGVWYDVDVVGIEADTTDTDNSRKLTFTYTLQAFNPGLLDLPPLGVIPTDGADTIFGNHLTLKVLPIDVDTIEMALKPIAGAVPPDSRWHDYIPLWIPWGLLVLILIAGACFVWLKLRRRKETAIIEAAKPIPPFELAMSRLNKLRGSGTAAIGHEKQFYTELTNILRQYLQGRFGINAMEMTSGQIVRTLRSNPETRVPADRMDAVLKIADFVKFAKERPLADDNERAIIRATEFVQDTKPAPEPQEEPESDKGPNSTK